MSVRTVLKILVPMLGVLFGASCLQAQSLPCGITVDSSFRVEFLFGEQAVRSSLKELAGVGEVDYLFRLDSKFNLPVLAGNVEVSPLTFMSGRLVGLTSVLEQSGAVQRLTMLAPESLFDAKPTFNSWEAAGLCHLWNAEGYRFSVTAGYRRESWSLEGVGVPGSSGVNLSSRDDSTYYGPFLGLQTAVFFPWWKARCELVGSPWMSRKISGSVIRTDSFVTYHGWGQGGLLEVRVEGTMHLTRFVFAGVHG
ncbi:MAG: hypothetical protein ACLQPD_25115, partial [Desulfomonilaceae bacterium]